MNDLRSERVVRDVQKNLDRALNDPNPHLALAENIILAYLKDVDATTVYEHSDRQRFVSDRATIEVTDLELQRIGEAGRMGIADLDRLKIFESISRTTRPRHFTIVTDELGALVLSNDKR